MIKTVLVNRRYEVPSPEREEILEKVERLSLMQKRSRKLSDEEQLQIKSLQRETAGVKVILNE